MSSAPQIIRLIDKAIDDGRLDKIIANKWAEGTPPWWKRGTTAPLPVPNQFKKDVRIALAEWLQCRLAPILEALGKDPKTNKVFASLLHKPWKACKDDEPHLSDLPAKVRKRRAQDLELRALTASMLYNTPSSLERPGKDIGERQLIADRLNEDIRRANAFWGNPSAWLCSVWAWWEGITCCKPMPGLPNWDGLREHQFYAMLPGLILYLVELCPGGCADNLKQALEKLRERVKSGRAPNNEKTESLLDWVGASTATLAIVYTDIDGYTKMCNSIGNAKMNKLLGAHLRQARRLAERTRGHVIKDNGDGVIAAFRTAPDALWFAIAFQEDPGCGGLSVRAGVHLGLVDISESNALGTAMNYAARVVDKARPAKVCLSSEAMRQIHEAGDPRLCGVNYQERRNCKLKDFGRKRTLWYVVKNVGTQVSGSKRRRQRQPFPDTREAPASRGRERCSKNFARLVAKETPRPAR